MKRERGPGYREMVTNYREGGGEFYTPYKNGGGGAKVLAMLKRGGGQQVLR